MGNVVGLKQKTSHEILEQAVKDVDQMSDVIVLYIKKRDNGEDIINFIHGEIKISKVALFTCLLNKMIVENFVYE